MAKKYLASKRSLISPERALFFYLAVVLLIIFNLPDYLDLGCLRTERSSHCWDIWRNGKFRYIFYALAPVAGLYFGRALNWVVGCYAGILLFSWTAQSYQITSMMALTISFGVMGLAAWLVQQDKRSIGIVLVWSGVIQALVAIPQRFGYHWLFEPGISGVQEAFGFYGQHTILGAFLICCLPPALWYKKYWQAALITLTMIFCDSTMTTVALGAIYLLFIWHKVSFKAFFYCAYFAAIFLAAGYFLSLDLNTNNHFYSISGRGPVWKAALEAIWENPVFGGGPGFWTSTWMPAHIPLVGGRHIPFQVHNDFLEGLVDYGFVLGIPVLLSLYLFAKNFRPTWHHAVCCGILLNATGNFPLQIASIGLVFLVCWSWSNSANEGAKI